MLIWSIQTTIISIILIFLVHHLITFFRNTLTVPKIKDLVNAPTQKYENMYQIISSHTPPIIHSVDFTGEEESISSNPKHDISSMKDELKSFLKKQFHNENIAGSTDISSLNQYAVY